MRFDWREKTFLRFAQLSGAERPRISIKNLQYSCEASDFGHKLGNTVQNFVKTESFRPRETL